MPLSPGMRLGPYEVLATLGVGGMGQVYRARDTRLGRDVALKLMGEAAARDGPHLTRFEQEARLAGSLNHPNVVVVLDVGVHEGVPYLVTELLHGETLRHRLERGRVPLETALNSDLLRRKRELTTLTLPGEFLFLFRIRFGLMSVLARLGARANWFQLERQLAIGAG